MTEEERKAFIHLNLYDMSPAEIACYARDARKELESVNARLTLLENVAEAAERLLSCGLDESDYAYVSALKHALRAYDDAALKSVGEKEGG